MAWRIVKQPNGYYARFSDIVDDFTHYDMTRDEALEVCREYFGIHNETTVQGKVDRADRHPERFEEELETIKNVHGCKRMNEARRELTAAPAPGDGDE